MAGVTSAADKQITEKNKKKRGHRDQRTEDDYRKLQKRHPKESNEPDDVEMAA